MTTAAPDRGQLVELLASFTGRPAETFGERIDSLELARLIYELEQRYGTEFDFTDDQLSQMSTVSGAVEVLRASVPA